MLKALQRDDQNLDVNWEPLSEMISSGRPCKRKIEFIKAEAVSSAEGMDLKGIRWHILERRSTTTRMQVKLLEEGRSVTKSIEIEDQGRLLSG